AAFAATLILLGRPAIQGRLPDQLRDMARSLHQYRLNARDEGLLQRGYYEQLNTAGRTGGSLWDIYAQRPVAWIGELRRSDIWRPRDDMLLGDLAPDTTITYKLRPFSTNNWGMRDRDYALAKPPGTRRIALLGPSL